MRNALILSVAFAFAVFSVNAQNTATINVVPASSPVPSPGVEEKKDNKKDKKKSDAEKNGSDKAVPNKFNLPPEKLSAVKIPRFETAPTIDGKLDEPFWKQAATFKDFFQTSPGDNVAPSKPTEVYMGYDAEHLYVAFYCWDEPDKIRATVAKRDNVFGEDNVRMWLDTYNDQRRAYVFGFNPLGIQQDGIYTEGQGADFSVDVVMESKGAIHQDGWAVEVKIPFKSLRYSIGKGKAWGFNVARNIDRFNDEFDQWLPDDRNISGFLVKHGKITGIEDIKVERTLELVPSITISETGLRKRTIARSRLTSTSIDPGKFVNEGIEADIGLTLKFNITPNITLDAAFNPDFAEIEADAPVVTANQRFPIFFQEKRPFFLEGVEIFQAPLQSFYSRTIFDPDIATKLTGKIDKTSFGFLVASDNAPGNYSEDERNDPPIRRRIDEFLDKNALFGVVRLKRDIGKENNIGFFGTARTFPKNRNFTGGFDGRFKLNPKLVSQFQVLGTHSRKFFFNPELDDDEYRTGNGVGYFWNLDYTEKNWGWLIEASGRSRDYRADAGFTRRTNTNSVFFANRLSTEPKPKAKLIRTDWRIFSRLTYDWKGRSTDGFIGTSFNFSFQGNLFISTEAGTAYERLFEEEFGAKRTVANPTQGAFFGSSERSAYQPYANVNVNKNFSKKLFGYGFFGLTWNAFDFDFGNGQRYPRVSPAYLNYLEAVRNTPTGQAPPRRPGLDPGEGLSYEVNVGAEYKPIDPLRVSLDYTKVNLKRYDTDRTAFDTNIFTLRSTYQFSRFTFARIRWDYDSLRSNASGQVLFGWNPNPGTAFYVGYNDNFNYNGFNPYTGQLEPRFERNSRTFFVRASYLFRKSF